LERENLLVPADRSVHQRTIEVGWHARLKGWRCP